MLEERFRSAVGRPALLLAVAWAPILGLALCLRAPSLVAAKPYINYVDEGNLLRPVARLLRDGGWDPHWYRYPQLPIDAIAAAMRAAGPLHRAIHGRRLREELSTDADVYDVVEPFELVVAGRAISLLGGLLIVALTGVLASRLAGARAGVVAGLVAAVTPALALRSGIASVDSLAAAFALGCLLLTAASRTAPRPGRAALAAGAMAGLASASKYPAGLVLIAFATTTSLLAIPLRERVRRCALAAAGAVAAFLLAMPAVLAHPGDVSAALRKQGAMYGVIASPTLWPQAAGTAEWDLRFDGPELGLIFLSLAAAGLVVATRDRSLASCAWGWVAFAVASVLIYGTRTFQPFRNLVPAVPILCVAVALLRARIPAPFRLAADALLVAWLGVGLAIPLVRHSEARRRLNDSRAEAIGWLAAHARAGDDVLIVRDLGILREEIRRLPARATVRWWEEIRSSAGHWGERFVVAGVLRRVDGPPVDVAALPAVRAAYVRRFSAGEEATAPIDWWWRGNRQIVCVMERRPASPSADARSPR